MKEQILVDKEHLEYLEGRDNWLTCLESAGVDNWEGIDVAFEMYQEEN